MIDMKELNKRIDEEVEYWKEVSAYSRWNVSGSMKERTRRKSKC